MGTPGRFRVRARPPRNFSPGGFWAKGGEWRARPPSPGPRRRPGPGVRPRGLLGGKPPPHLGAPRPRHDQVSPPPGPKRGAPKISVGDRAGGGENPPPRPGPGGVFPGRHRRGGPLSRRPPFPVDVCGSASGASPRPRTLAGGAGVWLHGGGFLAPLPFLFGEGCGAFCLLKF